MIHDRFGLPPPHPPQHQSHTHQHRRGQADQAGLDHGFLPGGGAGGGGGDRHHRAGVPQRGEEGGEPVGDIAISEQDDRRRLSPLPQPDKAPCRAERDEQYTA